ncbi:group I intron-associated PD-(D/E)XK endonuclease [Paenibacillus sp. SC116]|uniref:group I intron-associated PD-(D/E)XK endonuclease n=1 Tax=Paenibacillus sp. SC116 TaxID=2968986 RepID=UPI00215B6922|nr:group I intron-associated PD-(D/E)XK endonuclease [Paenibacillus sp. SC116]MCR8843125.1 group I intron-associated PD-(D/E)XK endonuclease [Paenibacillus sp. SC116]
MANESTNIGTHSELRVALALLANGYEVSKPIASEVYDLSVRDPRNGEYFTVQVKTARVREDRDGAIVVSARKNNGQIYSRTDCDFLAGVTEDGVYLIPNAEQTEYWAMPDLIDAKWTRLDAKYQRNTN